MLPAMICTWEALPWIHSIGSHYNYETVLCCWCHYKCPEVHVQHQVFCQTLTKLVLSQQIFMEEPSISFRENPFSGS